MSATEERKALDRLSQAYRRMTTPRARVPAETPATEAPALEAPQPGQAEAEQESRPSG